MVTLALRVGGQHFTDDVHVTRFKQLLPADSSKGREKDLVQFFTDRGERVVSVASLRPYVRRKKKSKTSDDE